MTRLARFLLLVSLAASRLPAETGLPDPVFSRIPFAQWLTEPESAHIRWTAQVSEPELSPHQRLVARLFARVDGTELSRRAGKGRFRLLVQIIDGKGMAWQNHQEIDLEHLPEGLKGTDVLFTERVFVMPGDYRVSMAVFDTATEEHSVVTRKLHVAPLKNDPLPGSWRDLSPVEFLPSSRKPDAWLLPSVRRKLRVEVETHEPVHVDVIVNLTPSARLEGSSRVQDRNLGEMLPAAKVLSQVEWKNAGFSLDLLDLSRRRVAYEKDASSEKPMRRADWWQAARSLDEVNPGIIDVKSLENWNLSAKFFVDEVKRCLGVAAASGRHERPVLIILSGKVEFEPGQEMNSIALDGASNARVFYIRYQPLPRIPRGPVFLEGEGRGAIFSGSVGGGRFAPITDQLEPLLKPLEPRLFDVATPGQFRKAIANIMAEVRKL